MSYADVEKKLVARAMKDGEFKKTLINDPHKAIKQELGIDVPPGVSVKVLADSPGTYHIVLPLSAQAQPQPAGASTFGGLTWSHSSTSCPNCG